MPTGYTQKLYDGKPQTFEEFALSCARAFAWWTRDLSGDNLPNPPVSDSTSRSLARYEAELERLEGLDESDVLREHEDEYWRIRKSNEKYRKEKSKLKARYQKMLIDVEAWEPPSETHEGLKKFMIEQLTGSIDFDCGDFTQTIIQQPFEWHRERIEHARKMVIRYREEAEKERQRNIDNQKWTDLLRESLSNE